jgi:hypothetical protein
MEKYYPRQPDVAIQDCGWHFSKLGGVEGGLASIIGYPHADMDTEAMRNRDLIAQKIRDGIMWDGREDFKIQYKEFKQEEYPAYVSEHPEIYDKYIWRP